jgi:hypothetical protein
VATGWAHEGAVLEQIEATVLDAVARARNGLPAGPALSHCAECGVRHCLSCQEALDSAASNFSGYNRRGSKDSQLR